jgi:hypothetical protein
MEYYIFGMTRDSFARVVPPPPDTTGKDTSAVGLFGGVYPNPFTESLTVTGAFERGGLEARLTNMLGQVVYEKVFTLTSTFPKIELTPPPLASGTYWLSLRQRNSQVGYKVLRR